MLFRSTEASAVLRIDGNYTWFWGLTISNSASTGSNYYKDGVFFGGANGKLINCIISNNGGNGIGFWQTAVNSEVYGCIIYHNGYSGDTRGHGHGIYGQNSSLLKIIRDNIMFHSYGIGIHIYSESGSIQGFSIEGNAIFNSGIPGAAFIERNILIGGLQEADRITITGNHIYNRPNYQSKASVQLGSELMYEFTDVHSCTNNAKKQFSIEFAQKPTVDSYVGIISEIGRAHV